ncbi:hypothetical protein [Massilia niabensis]|uniref:Uncharacterized protein n=1 Tax=Massilia niabensis TaxID=544910 RepID=A0ABW0L372_9BURK
MTHSLEQLIRTTLLQQQQSTDFYTCSYPHFLSTFARFSETKTWDEEAVILGLSAMYAWMPTTVRSHNPDAIAALPALLNAASPPAELVPVAVRCVNNSLVAGSKFLHLYNPPVYPIADSNTESWLWPGTSTMMARPRAAQRRYFEYMAAVEAVALELKRLAQEWSQQWFGYETTATRALKRSFLTGHRFTAKLLVRKWAVYNDPPLTNW